MNWTKEKIKELGVVRVTAAEGSGVLPIPKKSSFESGMIAITQAEGIGCYIDIPGVYDAGSVVWGPIGVLQDVPNTVCAPVVGDSWVGQDKTRTEIEGEFRVVHISKNDSEIPKYLVVVRAHGTDVATWMTLEHMKNLGYEPVVHTERQFIRVEDLPEY